MYPTVAQMHVEKWTWLPAAWLVSLEVWIHMQYIDCIITSDVCGRLKVHTYILLSRPCNNYINTNIYSITSIKVRLYQHQRLRHWCAVHFYKNNYHSLHVSGELSVVTAKGTPKASELFLG